jgi:Fe2+ transport system protein FeoA
MTLPELPPGQTARVIALRFSDAARLERLSAYGLAPGSVVRLVQLRPTLIVHIGETELALDHEVAQEIVVEKG